MILKERIDLLVQLGAYLRSEDDFLKAVFHRVAFNNTWLTQANSLRAANELGAYLQAALIQEWVENHPIQEPMEAKNIGLVLAGNTPLLGLLDMISIFLSGHQVLIKVAESDQYTLPHIVKMLAKWNPKSSSYFQVLEGFLKDFDAIIATKTNQKNNYFETYFKKYPHLLRTNKSSVAVLTGTESDAKLLALGDDVFAFFGLSPNNVSKLFLPKAYDLVHLLEIFHEYREIVLNNRYKNNFDYNYSLFLLNNMDFKANGCIILTEDATVASRIACLHFEYYENEEQLTQLIKEQAASIQLVVSEKELASIDTIKMGRCHRLNWFQENQTEMMQFLHNLT